MFFKRSLIYLILIFFTTSLYASHQNQRIPQVTNDSLKKKKIIYLTSDSSIPFWKIMSRGIKDSTDSLGYEFEIYNANNLAKRELELTVKAIQENVEGMIVSPTNSSACVTILKLAHNASIPVVIADIGTDSGEYISYISSDNQKGAYNIGKLLVKKMNQLGWEKGTVGIVAIPQKRLNGQQRTEGFMKALDEANIKGADIKQVLNWTYEETYYFVDSLIKNHPKLRAIWLQTSNNYHAAIDAIRDNKKEKELLFISFDAEPIFLELIPKNIIVGAAMQQPYLMGEKAMNTLHSYLNGKHVKKDIQLPILIVSPQNIEDKLSEIKLNVLGIK